MSLSAYISLLTNFMLIEVLQDIENEINNFSALA